MSRPKRTVELVIFGATGDLNKRKLLPALYELELAGRLFPGLGVVGVGRKSAQEADLAGSITRAAHEQSGGQPDAAALQGLLDRSRYVQATPDAKSLVALAADLAPSTLFHLALPPKLFAQTAQALAEVGLAEETRGFRRLIIEKPFGQDLASAQALNQALYAHWNEEQIYRIDHFLGKETVQNILVFRFANAFFEPLWNNRHLRQVQITVAESVGLEGRAGFYDGVGAMRDMVQNHLMQLLTLTALEPPPRLEAGLLHDEKVKVLRSIRPLEPGAVVRGQYEGYDHEPGVAPGSRTETFTALRLQLDNWRWTGVPFYLRTGKHMRRKYGEIALQFNSPPQQLFRQHRGAKRESDWLVIEVQPTDCLNLTLQVKQPGLEIVTHPLTLTAPYTAPGTNELSAYAALILDALGGDRSLFLRYDEVEWAWRIIDPVLKAWAEDGDAPEPYVQGSEGPLAQARILREGDAWRPF